MKWQVFAVHDAKVGAYLPVFQARSPGEAQRSFQQAVNNPEHQFGQSPEDFTLFRLAKLEDQTGAFEPDKVSICNGIEVWHGPDEGERTLQALT